MIHKRSYQILLWSGFPQKAIRKTFGGGVYFEKWYDHFVVL